MYDGNSRIAGAGVATAASIDSWLQAVGRQLAPQYAPDGTYRQPPAVGEIIVRLCGQVGLNSDLVAAQACHESAGGQSAIFRAKWNPSGLGAENDDPYGKAKTFATPEDGIRATIAHLLSYTMGRANPWWADDPRAAAMPASYLGSVRALSDLDGKWAYPGVGYGASIARLANELVASGEGNVSRHYHVALSYGHNNTDGGNERERAQTPVIGAAVRDACRALGMEVRVVQDERGNGLSLDDVAQTVVDWDRAGWPVDLYLEVHSEGAGGAQGVFGIYPDWDGDYDGDAERISRDAAVRISAAVDGLGVRGGGAMSEKSTYVGSQGYRLGIFRVTTPIKDHATRLILEYGAHDDDAEYQAVMSHIPQLAAATAAAFATEAMRLGFAVGTAPAPTPPQPPSENRYFPETEHYLSHGFKGFWEAEPNALEYWGYPISEEFTDPDTGITVQWLERARFEYQPAIAGNEFGVVLGLIGAEALADDQARFPEAFQRRDG